MSDMKFTLFTDATIHVHVGETAPSDWLSRVTTDDFPYKHSDRTPLTEDDGIRMLADNAIRNGVYDASRLDGWGDLETGMVRIEVEPLA